MSWDSAKLSPPAHQCTGTFRCFLDGLTCQRLSTPTRTARCPLRCAIVQLFDSSLKSLPLECFCVCLVFTYVAALTIFAQLTAPIAYKFLDVDIWVGGQRTGGIRRLDLLQRKPWEELVEQQQQRKREYPGGRKAAKRTATRRAIDEEEDEEE